MKKSLLILITLLTILTSLDAKHIIGGDISYECLGGNNYRVTLKVYRDCYSGGAEFDEPAFVYVFDAFKNQVQKNAVSLDFQENIPVDINNPCLVNPPDVCVESGSYIFEIQLPESPGGYDIVYQRCCRNETINNIINPGEVGTTYVGNIPDPGLATCNTSPSFDNFPPIAICANELLIFDHSASEPDGDELVYELCRPFIGATPDCPQPGSNNCGVTTTEVEPPPYNQVQFQSPFFDVNYPLGNQGTPLTINPQTGELTGFPNRIGQFVVGICVKEYRNGQLISTSVRDFQFNVTSCDRAVFADIDADSIKIVNNTVIYNFYACESRTINFNNNSVGASNYFWEFFDKDGSSMETSTLMNPTVVFPDTGMYDFYLVAEPGLQCEDSLIGIVNVFPILSSDFELISPSSCDFGSFTFTNETFVELNQDVDYTWDFGDGNTSNDISPTHTYENPGLYIVTLSADDENGCNSETNITINYFPTPDVDFEVDEIGCAPFHAQFDNLTTPSNGYDYIWTFGDGTVSSEFEPLHVYEEAGIYSVLLEVISPSGCDTFLLKENLITVLPRPVSLFSFQPEVLSNFKPEATFTDLSEDAVSWEWNFGTGDFSNEQNPIYTYPDTGKYNVALVVTHENGCKDTSYQTVCVEPKYVYHLPNAFTPNNDGTNDFFIGKGDFTGMKSFKFQIWNRWGELIFETSDPNEGWNGRKNNTGEHMIMGVYVCTVQIIDFKDKIENINTFATLVL